jgi:hypothetical protein
MRRCDSLQPFINNALQAPHSLHLPQGLSRVCEVVATGEFVLRLNDHDYTLSIVEAVFLSPRVFSALKTDSTIRFFDITDPRIDHNHFGDLLDIVHGRPVKVTAASRLSLLRLSSRLGNADLARIFFGLREQEALNEEIQTSVRFDLTAHNREDLFLLDCDALEQLFISEELQIESEDWLLELILELGDDYRRLLNCVKFEFLTTEVLSRFLGQFDYSDVTGEIWSSLARRLIDGQSNRVNSGRYGRKELSPGIMSGVRSAVVPRFESAIVSEFPPVLSVIEGKKTRLLYRGTRDGFTRASCTPRVAGHSNLLILVQTKRGWIFGGYAHCEWPDKGWSGDPSLKSFLFTLRNPHNIPDRRFALRSEYQENVLHVHADSRVMLWMGASGGIGIWNYCNTNSQSHNSGFTDSGSFANDSGCDGKTLFTGSETYLVQELEIFECFN